MSFGPSPDLSGNVTPMAVCVNCTGAAVGNPMRFQNYGGMPAIVGAPGNPCNFGSANYPSAYPVYQPTVADAVSQALGLTQGCPGGCP